MARKDEEEHVMFGSVYYKYLILRREYDEARWSTLLNVLVGGVF